MRADRVQPYIDELVAADLMYKDRGTYVLRPVDHDTIWHAYDDNNERRRYNLFAPLFAPYIADGKRSRAIRKRWSKGTGDPPLRPSHWKRKSWRAHHDGRWGKEPCQGCQSYAVVAGEDFCDLCLLGQDERAEQEARNPAHGEPDHEDDGRCGPCDADAVQFHADNADDAPTTREREAAAMMADDTGDNDPDEPLTEDQQDALDLAAEARERERAEQ